MVWKMQMFSNKYPNPGWWTERRIDKYSLKHVFAFKQVSESGVAGRNKEWQNTLWIKYEFSNKYPNPGWWTEMRKDKYGLENVYAFKRISESGRVDRHKNKHMMI